jgi:hypothetical protein
MFPNLDAPDRTRLVLLLFNCAGNNVLLSLVLVLVLFIVSSAFHCILELFGIVPELLFKFLDNDTTVTFTLLTPRVVFSRNNTLERAGLFFDLFTMSIPDDDNDLDTLGCGLAVKYDITAVLLLLFKPVLPSYTDKLAEVFVH